MRKLIENGQLWPSSFADHAVDQSPYAAAAELLAPSRA